MVYFNLVLKIYLKYSVIKRDINLPFQGTVLRDMGRFRASFTSLGSLIFIFF